MSKKGPIVSLTCCCCGASTKGRQWYNRDTGFGLCDKCADWIGETETPEQMEKNYGVRAVHYKIGEKNENQSEDRAIQAG